MNQAFFRNSLRFYSALAILEPQIYVVVEQFGAENISAFFSNSLRFYSALAILEPQIYVVVEQFGAENISAGVLFKGFFKTHPGRIFKNKSKPFSTNYLKLNFDLFPFVMNFNSDSNRPKSNSLKIEWQLLSNEILWIRKCNSTRLTFFPLNKIERAFEEIGAVDLLQKRAIRIFLLVIGKFNWII